MWKESKNNNHPEASKKKSQTPGNLEELAERIQNGPEVGNKHPKSLYGATNICALRKDHLPRPNAQCKVA